MINWDNAQAWEKFNKAQEMLEEVRMEKLESTKNEWWLNGLQLGKIIHEIFLNFIKAMDCTLSLKNCYMKDNLL
jgi:hypothetical protein